MGDLRPHDKRLFIGHEMGQGPAQRGSEEAVHATGRLLGVLALALTLASCDKCGNWLGSQAGLTAPSGLGACRNTVPQH